VSEAARDRFLPYSRQSIGEDDIAAVSAVLRSDFLTTGPLVEEFEAAFAKSVGARFAVACNSGTAALHLAVLGLDLKTTDVAIVPSITFLATANVVRLAGAHVVFCDVDPDSGLMTPETLSEGIERAAGIGAPRIVLPVHLRGHVADMQSLSQIARARPRDGGGLLSCARCRRHRGVPPVESRMLLDARGQGSRHWRGGRRNDHGRAARGPHEAVAIPRYGP
jgi:hypothetical protein